MALKLSIDQSNVGVPFAEAYARIVTVNGTKDRISYMVMIYANEQARQGNAREVVTAGFDAPTPEGPLFPGLYAHLKAQPGFETAVDV
jgi:hypothetical protein